MHLRSSANRRGPARAVATDSTIFLPYCKLKEPRLRRAVGRFQSHSVGLLPLSKKKAPTRGERGGFFLRREWDSTHASGPARGAGSPGRGVCPAGVPVSPPGFRAHSPWVRIPPFFFLQQQKNPSLTLRGFLLLSGESGILPMPPAPRAARGPRAEVSARPESP